MPHPSAPPTISASTQHECLNIQFPFLIEIINHYIIPRLSQLLRVILGRIFECSLLVLYKSNYV